ncbi:MAG TPA: hypothetical protein VMJ90_00785, partial [Anaerolineales bacterium]|nr:hypothetical protein [Anaerolineales bacterium]
MSLSQILILVGVAIVLGRLKQGRSLILLLVSGLVMYWLQPKMEPVNLMYWFPTLTLALAAVSWVLTLSPETRGWSENRAAAGVLAGLVIFLGANRYLQLEQLFVLETPRLQWVLLVVVLVFALIIILARINPPRFLLVLALIGLVVMLAILKYPSAGAGLFDLVAGFRGKDPGGVSGLTWLG